jgi:two-component system, cell cycle response regulator
VSRSVPGRGRGPITVGLQRLWLATVGIGLTFFVAHTGFDFGGHRFDSFTSTWVYDGLEVAAVLAVAARAVAGGEERVAWTLLAVGLASWTLGDLSWSIVYGGNPPFPSVADAFYLCFYPPTYLGLALLVRHRFSRFNRSVWLDGLVGALAVASVGAAVLLGAVLHSAHDGLLAGATNLAYPLGDIVLVGFVAGIFGISGGRPGPGWAAIGGALVITALADGIYLYQTAVGTYVSGTILDALWPASLLLLGCAAWILPDRHKRVSLEGRALAGTPVLCGLVALVVLVDSYLQHRNAVGVAFAAAAIVFVIVRSALTLRENAQINEHMNMLASTDALTGLWNRRRLMADLEEAIDDHEGGQRVLVLYDLNGFKRYNDTFGHPAGDALLMRLADKLGGAVSGQGCSYRLGGDEFCALAFAETSELEQLLDRTTEALSETGDAFDISAAFGCVILPDEAANSEEAIRIADKRLYAQKYGQLILRGQPHAVLLQALEEREPTLRQHVVGVAALSVRVGARLGLTGAALEELELAAQMHDIGKLAIPDAILDKPGPLDADETAFIRRHPVIGQRIVDASPALAEVGKIVRATHERWDGSGYPDRVNGAEIPLAARIIAVCDAYSAMIDHRPYARAETVEQACAELRRCAGADFDPQVVEAFCALDLSVAGSPVTPAPRSRVGSRPGSTGPASE